MIKEFPMQVIRSNMRGGMPSGGKLHGGLFLLLVLVAFVAWMAGDFYLAVRVLTGF